MPRKRDDRRSPEAAAARKLYKTARWQKLRDAHLREHPLCTRCLSARARRLTPATVVHHKEPHKGDEALFFDPANLESICAKHHNSDAQSEEKRGYSTEVGPNGWPIDPRHPQHRYRVDTDDLDHVF